MTCPSSLFAVGVDDVLPFDCFRSIGLSSPKAFFNIFSILKPILCKVFGVGVMEPEPRFGFGVLGADPDRVTSALPDEGAEDGRSTSWLDSPSAEG